MTKQENVIERVRKLLALSESPNENEAKAALQKAYDLLAKHKLQIQDVEGVNAKDINIIRKITDISFTRQKGYWKYCLIEAIANNYCVGIFTNYQKGKRKRNVVLMGAEEDLLLCLELYDFASKYVEDFSKIIKRVKKYTTAEMTKIENAYGIGFSEGVNDMFEEQRKNNEEEWGIILSTPKEVQDYINSLDTDSSKEKINIHPEVAYRQMGYKDGITVSFNDKLSML